MKKIFEEEMKRRNEADDNTYNMIGTELKRLRLSKAQTLSMIADNVCSVSYLCKIENAKLKPNRYMLNEICRKLDVSKPVIEILFRLKEYLLDMVSYYYNEDYESLRKTYEKCKEFDNYRSSLICLIYYIAIQNIDEAAIICKELSKITSAMLKEELSIFMLFYSILRYYQESFKEALDNFKTLEKIESANLVSLIAKIFSLKCYFKLDHPMTLIHGQKLTDYFLNTLEFFKLDYIRYLIAIYTLNNDLVQLAIEQLNLIQDEKFKNSLELFIDIKLKTIKEESSYNNLRPYAFLFKTYIFSRQTYLTTFLNMDKKLFLDCEFSYNFASYLTLSDDEERIVELKDVIIPNISQTGKKYERRFFLDELCRISTSFGRYKCFSKAYRLLSGGLI